MISVDPGAHPGYAVFDRKVLIHAGTEWVEAWRPYCDELIIEHPTIYPHSKARPNDIVTLAITAGRMAQRVGAEKEIWVLPRQWKGSIPKTRNISDYLCYKRVLAVLTDSENLTLAWALGIIPKAREFDVVDAVGIGLWGLRRFRAI
jgi:hypothetical protein